MFTMKGWKVVFLISLLLIVLQGGLAILIYDQVLAPWFLKICLADFLGMTALLRVLCQMLPENKEEVVLKVTLVRESSMEGV